MRVFAGILIAGAFVFMAQTASAVTVEGKCHVQTGLQGKSKFVVLKCAKNSAPGDFIIRNSIFERKDPKGFKELSKLSGHSFSCQLTRGKTSIENGWEMEHYKLEKCH